MTLIQPNKNNAFIINRILILLVAALFIAAVWLVVLYNRLVNIDHSISRMKSEIQSGEARSAELKGQVLTLLDGASLGDFAGARGLVQEKKPQYITIQDQWLASQ